VWRNSGAWAVTRALPGRADFMSLLPLFFESLAAQTARDYFWTIALIFQLSLAGYLEN